MKHKQKLCTLLALSLMGTMGAKAQSMLWVSTTNGAPTQSFALEDVGKITFDSSNMLFTYQGESRTFDLATLGIIRFGDTNPTAVTMVSAPDDGLQLSRNTISAPGWRGTKGLRVYSATGQLLLHDAGWAGESILLAGLPHGTYIVKTSMKTIKICK